LDGDADRPGHLVGSSHAVVSRSRHAREATR
jgi:hypothetical protein